VGEKEEEDDDEEVAGGRTTFSITRYPSLRERERSIYVRTYNSIPCHLEDPFNRIEEEGQE